MAKRLSASQPTQDQDHPCGEHDQTERIRAPGLIHIAGDEQYILRRAGRRRDQPLVADLEAVRQDQPGIARDASADGLIMDIVPRAKKPPPRMLKGQKLMQ